MATICRVLKDVGKHILLKPTSRSLSLTASVQNIQIIERQEGNNLVIEGVKVDSSQDPLQIHNDSGACPLCALGVDIKHTDVLILKQFLRPDGCMLPRRITGLCNTQQRRVGFMIAMAQKAGLMPNIAPPNSKGNPAKRREWKKFHTYYDEETIPYRLR